MKLKLNSWSQKILYLIMINDVFSMNKLFCFIFILTVEEGVLKLEITSIYLYPKPYIYYTV